MDHSTVAAHEALLEEWVKSYPESEQAEFHRDGIVRVPLFKAESTRLLFVLAEPNSKGGKYDRYRGWDMREIFGNVPIAKEVNLNLALWARAILDDEKEYVRMSAEEAMHQLRRVAIINLKKLPGSGTGDWAAVERLAWRDRARIRQQIQMIAPTLVVACGPKVNRPLGHVLSDDRDWKAPGTRRWTRNGVCVVPGNHPSLRPRYAVGAFERLLARFTGRQLEGERTGVSDSSRSRGASMRQHVRRKDSGARVWWCAIDRRHSTYESLVERKVVAQGWPKLGDLTPLLGLLREDPDKFMLEIRNRGDAAYADLELWKAKDRNMNRAPRVFRTLLSIRKDDLVVGIDGRAVRGVGRLGVDAATSYRYDPTDHYAQTVGRPVEWVDYSPARFGFDLVAPAQGIHGIKRVVAQAEHVMQGWKRATGSGEAREDE